MSDIFRPIYNLPSRQQQSIHENCVHPTNAFVTFQKEEIEQSVSDRFEEQVKKYPERIAVKTKHHKLTYDALNKAANRIARAILSQYEKEEESIALLLDHGALMIFTILGVLKAGKIYVALDPSFPCTRNAFILEDSRAELIVTDNQNLSLAKELAQNGLSLINMDEVDSSISAENLGLSISPDTFAYILYTSGSTGQPKGVVQNHRNVLHNIMKHTNSFHICTDDRLTLFASCSTGQAVTDIYSALLNGASLYPMNIKQEGLAHLAAWLNKEAITIYHSSATVFRYFVETLTGEEEFDKIRLIKLGSESVLSRDVELYKKHFPQGCILANTLSSSEAGGLLTYFIDKGIPINRAIVPVGYPLEDMEILVLDEAGEEVGVNNIGEIAVKSRYICLGYWRRPDLTQGKFLPDPKGGDKHIYLTGDLGRMLPEGCLVHMGRKDNQVKIRGFRIELGEIEKVLYQHPGVKQVVVLAREDEPGNKRLVAYIVPEKDSKPSTSELRDFLKTKLPEYMIPAVFIMLDSLPLTPNGKVDRKVLPAPDHKRPEMDKVFVAPSTPTEIKLADIWGRLLSLKEAGVNDNFFELGGDSLLTTQLISRIREVFQVDLPLRVVFEGPFITAVARKIEQIKEETRENEKLGRLLDELEGLSDEKTQKRLKED